TYSDTAEGVADDVAMHLLEAVESLPPPFRRVITMFHFRGDSGPEIADTLGISHSAVKWRLREARRRLRERLSRVVDKDTLWTKA
ncbi:MAG: hypothetical protein IIA44_12675, partial [Acidobacteria bacterium]|nr:hypothetical protein [Acidobacteriota bacterium]